MKKYKLLKDIPGFKAGDIIPTESGAIGTTTIYSFGGESVINEEYAKRYPDFFEEIIEKKTYDDLVHMKDKIWSIAWNGDAVCSTFSNEKPRSETFLTKQEAEDEHKRREWANRKDKFIPEEGDVYWSYYPYGNRKLDTDTFYHTFSKLLAYDIFAVNQGLAFRTKEECKDAIDNHDIVRLFYTIR